MANFIIVNNDIEYDCSLKKEQINEYINISNQIIPLHSLDLWKKYYYLMGRNEKVMMIEKE